MSGVNQVILSGRLTRDPEVRHISESQTTVANFTLAIDRPVKSGQEKKTDFPRVTVFGRQAENCERFLAKGRLVGIQGRIQTGSYTNKDGAKVYTTDIVAEEFEFAESKNASEGSGENKQATPQSFTAPADDGFLNIPDGIDEELPFN